MAAKKNLLVYKSCKMDDIIAWCSANGKVEWLKAICVAKPQFFTIKKSFFEAFMPDAIPVKKPKKATIYDIVEAL